MLGRVLWIFLGVEALRFVAWIAFLLWLASAFDSSTWVGAEAPLVSILVASWLGFPYSWIASWSAGSWNFLPIAEHVTMSVALTHFALWLLATAFIAFVLYRLSRLKCRSIGANE